MNPKVVKNALDKWLSRLNPKDPRFRHHQVEAMWTYRNLELINIELLEELLNCENHNARAAAATTASLVFRQQEWKLIAQESRL